MLTQPSPELKDLHTWGADSVEAFSEKVGGERYGELLQQKLIRVGLGNTFDYVELGSKGRIRFGLAPNHKTEAAAAARYIMRREAKAQLEARGLRFVGVHDRVLRRFEGGGQTVFLAASIRAGSDGYTARSVRKLQKRYQVLLWQSQATLVIATPQAGKLKRTVAKHAQIETLKVDGRICRVG